MEQIGTQIKLPLQTAFRITLQGIRIRLGRALVTISGVVLGIAFFMSVMVGELIKRTIAQEQELRQTSRLMSSLVQSEVGSIQGKNIAIVVLGKLSQADEILIHQILSESPALVSGFGLSRHGIHSVGLEQVAKESDLLLLLGNAQECSFSLGELAGAMRQKVVLDSVSNRRFTGQTDASVRRESFFGQKTAEEEVLLGERARQERFRTLWIVGISLLVTVIGIANALLMSVTERFREIGTMKCLGALSVFIRQLFVIESSIIGLTGSILGVLLGILMPLLTYGMGFGFGIILSSLNYLHFSLITLLGLFLGTSLSILAAIYPAQFASRMVPAMALRSNI
jgi:hypothetical protein